jgi:hypothetical protein
MQRSAVRTALAGIGGLLLPLGLLLAAPAPATPDDCRHSSQGCSPSDCSTEYLDCDQGSSVVLPVTGEVPAIA